LLEVIIRIAYFGLVFDLVASINIAAIARLDRFGDLVFVVSESCNANRCSDNNQSGQDRDLLWLHRFTALPLFISVPTARATDSLLSSPLR